jgi:hypothetical protein
MKLRMTARKLGPEAYRAVADLDRRVVESGIEGGLYLLISSAPPRSTAAPSV